MAFDPDKYLAQAPQASQGFDPNAYLGIASGGNIINTDVPTVVGQVANPPIVQAPKRTMMDRVKALYEVPLTVGSAAVAGPVSSAYGVYKSATSPQFGTPQGTQVGQQVASDLARRMTYTPTSPVAQEFLQDVGQIGEAAKLPPLIPTTGMIPSYARMASASQPVLREAAQTAQQTAQPVATKLATALRKTPSEQEMRIKTAPSAEELAVKSNQLFDVAKNAGIEINPKDFSSNMKQIAKSLEDIGYDPELHPDIATVIKRLTDPNVPKDFNKIKALRTMIGDLQNADTKLKRSIATNLKEDLDSYLSTIPDSSVTSGSKEGLKAWKEARDVYSRMSKAEIFDEMLENAQLDKSKFTMSGVENSLAQQLRQLAKNNKKMRLFTDEEQEAIKQAAKGSTLQNLLKFYGRFSPTGPVSGIFAGGALYANPAIAIPFEIGAVGARMGATKMRKSDVEKLAALMRAGKKAEEQK